jgi:hypothetical protein
MATAKITFRATEVVEGRFFRASECANAMCRARRQSEIFSLLSCAKEPVAVDAVLTLQYFVVVVT